MDNLGRRGGVTANQWLIESLPPVLLSHGGYRNKYFNGLPMLQFLCNDWNE